MSGASCCQTSAGITISNANSEMRKQRNACLNGASARASTAAAPVQLLLVGLHWGQRLRSGLRRRKLRHRLTRRGGNRPWWRR